MAYDFEKAKKLWESQDAKWQADYALKNANDPNFKRFQQDYKALNAWWNMNTPNTGSVSPNLNSVTSTNNNVVTNGSAYTGVRRNGDMFGDSGYSNEKTQYQGTNTTGSTGFSYNPNYKFGNLPSNIRFWNNAMTSTGWYLTERNNNLAMAFFNEWKTSEDDIYNYLMQYNDFANFDEKGRRNTVTAIIKRIWSLASQYGNNNNQRTQAQNLWDVGIMGTNNWATGDYWTNVNRVMKESQWFDLEQMKQMYPSEFSQMYQYLASMKDVWDSTAPEQRKELDAQIQKIIGTGVGTGSDVSTLNRFEEAVWTKFKNPDKVSEDMRNVMNLQTRGMTTEEIAKQLGMTPDQVTQLILLANGDKTSRAGDYYMTSDILEKQVTEPYDRQRDRLAQEKQIALDRANEQLARLKEDFDIATERQKKKNEIDSHNAHFLASKYWFAFSDRGLQWLQYVGEQAQQMLDDLQRNYDRSNKDIADWISDIIRTWQWNNDDLIRESEEALRDAKNNYLSAMIWIQNKYWVLWQQAQQMYANSVQSFIEQAENIYDRALTRQQNNLTTFVNWIANLNAIQAQNYTMQQQYYKDFQAMSQSMNWSKVRDYANKYWLDEETLMSYQVQQAQNLLNGAQPGAWIEFASELRQLVEGNYSPIEAVQSLMNSSYFKEKYPNAKLTTWMSWGILYDANGNPVKQYDMSGWIMYNMYTGDSRNLNSTTDWLPASIQKVKSADGSEIFIDLATGQVVDPSQIAGLRDWSASKADHKFYTMKDSNGNEILVDATTGQAVSVDEMLKNTKQDSLITSYKNWLKTNTSSFLNKYWISGTEEYKPSADWVKWWECGTFVNNYLNSLWIEWRVFWSSLESKKKAITPGVNNPIVGAVVVMDTGVKLDDWTPAGHVGIVTKVFDDWSFLVTDSNWNHKQQVATHKIEKWSNAYKSIEWYYLPGYTELEKELANTNSSDSWNNLSDEEKYYQVADVANLTKAIFWGNASDKDAKRVQEMVELWNKLWKSRQEIIYDWAWFRIDWDENKKNFANTLMWYMEKHTNPDTWIKWTYDLASIANRINKWDYASAVQNMEIAMRSQFWDKSTVSEERAMAMVSKLNRLYNDFQKIKWLTWKLTLAEVITNYWWWSSNINNMLWLTDEEVKTVASVSSQIKNAFAEIRNQLAGTAVTETESRWLQPMIPSIYDNSTVFETKVKEAITNYMKDQNATRRYLWLPIITKISQFTDWDKRAELYWANTWNTTWTKIKK